MAEPTARSEPRHPVQVDIGGFEEIVAGAQAVLHTDDESATVREILEVFVQLVLEDQTAATSVQDVRAVVQRFFERARHGENVRTIVDRSNVPFDGDDVERSARARGYGIDRGVYLVPADFDSPLPEDVLSSFES